MAIFGQFTKRAQQVLMTAQECATREGQPYVGTLHFLYGLLDVGEAPESVTRHIQKEDVKQVLDQIDDEVSLHPGHGPVQMTNGVPLTKEAMSVTAESSETRERQDASLPPVAQPTIRIGT